MKIFTVVCELLDIYGVYVVRTQLRKLTHFTLLGYMCIFCLQSDLVNLCQAALC
jgi:hypothetical protein